SDDLGERNRLRVVVRERDSFGLGQFVRQELFVHGPPRKKPPALHVLTFAATQYPGTLKLDYAVKDAVDILQLFQRQAGRSYSRVDADGLKESQITRQNVRKCLDRVTRRLAESSADDLLVVFLSGHGHADGPEYFFVPPDPRLDADFSGALI